jgi:lipopolysaccharide exporter
MQVITSRHSFASDVLKLTSGTVFSQAIGIFAAPLLARLYLPEAFGIAAVFVSICSVLTIVVCLRYDRSIIVPASDQEAMNLAAVSLLFVIAITALSTILLALGKSLLLNSLKVASLGPFLWLVPINVFASGLLAILNSWNTRKRHFTLVTLGQMASAMAYIGIVLTAGIAHKSSAGYLIVGNTAALLVSAIVLLLKTLPECCPTLIGQITLKEMAATLRRYKNFPKYGTAAGVLSTLSWELPAFFLSGFFSPGVVGQYSLGNRVIRIPMSFIGLNISRVFSQRAAEANLEHVLTPLADAYFRVLVRLSLFPFLLLTVAGGDLFDVVFGSRWNEAGTYTQILSLWAFFWFVSGPLTCLLDILGEQAFDMKMNALILASRIISLTVGGYLGSARLALVFFSVSGVLVYGYYCTAVLHKSGVLPKRALTLLVNEMLKFIPFGVVLYLAKWLAVPSPYILLISLIMLCFYYVNLIRRDAQIQEIILRSLQTLRSTRPRSLKGEVLA